MKKYMLVSFIAIATLSLVGRIFAEEYIVGGNGAGSNNSIQISGQSQSVVVQENTATVNNSINADSNTGGNSVSGSQGGSINTGDATTKVTVTNALNSNSAQVTCCVSPTPSDPKMPTPTPAKATGTPTPTQGPSGGGVNNNGGGGSGDNANGGGSSGSSTGGTGGGEILGLSATSGDNSVLNLIGSVCVTLGSLILTVKSRISA